MYRASVLSRRESVTVSVSCQCVKSEGVFIVSVSCQCVKEEGECLL